MNKMNLIGFLKACPTAYHTIDTVSRTLNEEGYVRLAEGEPWHLSEGGKYYVTRNQASIIAFRMPKGRYAGFHIAAGHSDSPSLKIKENPEIVSNGYVKLNVEKYGGAILSGWLDRPLGIAGRVLVREDGKIVSKLVRIDRDLLVIPSLAIHMNRKVNDSQSWNVQEDLLPVLSLNEKTKLMDLIAGACDVKTGDILGHDLFLYVREEGRIIGAENDMILAPHLDDLQCVWGILGGFLKGKESDHVPVLAVFDNEETGSLSAQGADSTFLKDTLDRINIASGLTAEESECTRAESFMVSADNAHAVHPNHPEKADPVNRPRINAGIVIKYNANQKYTSDGVSAALFRTICRRAHVPCQIFTNRSDMAGGSTLGNLSNRHVSLHTVDIGLPQLAMHSCMETAGVKDTEYLEEAMRVFFSSSFAEDGNTYRI